MRKFFKKERRRFKQILTHPTFLFLTILGNLVLFICVTALYFLERELNPNIQTFFDSLWWGVSTITTIGFGDVVPITTAGRIVAMVLMYTGTILFIGFTGVLVSLWMAEEVEEEIFPLEKELKEEERETLKVEYLLKDIQARLSQLEKYFKKD